MRKLPVEPRQVALRPPLGSQLSVFVQALVERAVEMLGGYMAANPDAIRDRVVEHAPKWLPKWVSDVATVVHFYEAVLATLAIVVWHLYFVIFDPVVYPMDTAWITGRAPLARVLERGHAARAPSRERKAPAVTPARAGGAPPEKVTEGERTAS